MLGWYPPPPPFLVGDGGPAAADDDVAGIFNGTDLRLGVGIWEEPLNAILLDPVQYTGRKEDR